MGFQSENRNTIAVRANSCRRFLFWRSRLVAAYTRIQPRASGYKSNWQDRIAVESSVFNCPYLLRLFVADFCVRHLERGRTRRNFQAACVSGGIHGLHADRHSDFCDASSAPQYVRDCVDGRISGAVSNGCWLEERPLRTNTGCCLIRPRLPCARVTHCGFERIGSAIAIVAACEVRSRIGPTGIGRCVAYMAFCVRNSHTSMGIRVSAIAPPSRSKQQRLS
jgi:hypothetical protein